VSTRLRLRRSDGRVYLDRWGIECSYGGIFLHRMDAPDPGVDLHTHPWPFVSIVLWGGYTEERCRNVLAPHIARAAERDPLDHRRGVDRRRRWLSIASTPLEYCHRIVELHGTPTWTLVIRGRKVRPWGFILPSGWMHWEEYDRTVRADRRDLWAEISNVDEERRQ
jgi:hypothetical protein